MISKTKALESSRKALNVTGLRATSQRALILEIIRRGHLDADEIYRQAKEKQANISLSTVYRTLRMFKKLGLVAELHFDEEHHHYEVKPFAEHHHLVCLSCGEIMEFESPLSKIMKKNTALEKNFEVTSVEIRMTGLCSKCRTNKS